MAQTFSDERVEEFDVVILGGGTGSTVAAWTFAGEGRSVAVVDRKYIGGSCPNIACLPSKNIIHSAQVVSYNRRSAEFGIPVRDVNVDMSVVRERKRRMVSALNELYLENYRNTGAELIFGEGRFVGPKTLEVRLKDGTTRRLLGKNVIVSTGTHAAMGSIPGLNGASRTNRKLSASRIDSGLVLQDCQTERDTHRRIVKFWSSGSDEETAACTLSIAFSNERGFEKITPSRSAIGNRACAFSSWLFSPSVQQNTPERGFVSGGLIGPTSRGPNYALVILM